MPLWDPAQPYVSVIMPRLKQPACADPIWSPTSDEELMRRTLEIMERRNVIGVVSGTPERVAAWRAAAPDRLIPGVVLAPVGPIALSVDSLRALHAAGELDVLGEVVAQYAGIAADDAPMEPYWQLAEELDIPVALHVGPGPPGAMYLGFDGYRARLSSALALEEVLARHPQVRVYVMHAGYPLIDDMLAVLYAHPQVHVDVGVIAYTQPRAAFYGYLQRIVDAGFVDRVMFGSDQMVWPEALERSIRVIEEAPFLDEGQKRAILYDNAARFLRLTPEQIEAHRRM
jgi:hypothetical protein